MKRLNKYYPIAEYTLCGVPVLVEFPVYAVSAFEAEVLFQLLGVPYVDLFRFIETIDE